MCAAMFARRPASAPLLLLLVGLAAACSAGSGAPDAQVAADAGPRDAEVAADAGVPDGSEGTCLLAPGDTDPDYVTAIGCRRDHDAVASPPIVAGIPGTLSAKTVIDQLDGDRLYIQNSRRYPIHWEFATAHLSGDGLPIVPPLGQFNQTEYYAPDRRFLLGALNHYEGPGVWAYEIAPYDTASAAQIEKAFRKVRAALWDGARLAFHPTSDAVEREAAKLPPDVPVVTTGQLFAGIEYQPLNLATSIGQLRFFSEADLRTGYVGFRDLAVLEAIPNDLSTCAGTITAEFQTPLSHINVLAQNRGTPNMALVGAFTRADLRALEGKWVELTVGASRWSIREVTVAEADAWWEAHRPAPLTLREPDLTVEDLRDVEDLLELDRLGLREALAKAIPAFGGKASHYAAFPHIRSFPIPYPKAFVIPIARYRRFMEANGFLERVARLRADPLFTGDPAMREAALARLRADIEAAPLDPALEAEVVAKLRAEYPGLRMKFRSSTNAEDLDGFTGAGLYTSAAGDPADPTRPVAAAIKKVWASVWRYRAYEEREYRSIDHGKVGMAVLVHRSFPDEDLNGVAITGNIFDTRGIEPGFYVNAQVGETSVVLPPPGVSSDQFLYHHELPGQPIVYFAHSSLVPAGQTVMSRAQVLALGEALAAIHAFFDPVYGPSTPERFFAMDVEFKFNTYPEDPTRSVLVIKQARPYPGRGR
jgi:hypothetical protein